MEVNRIVNMRSKAVDLDTMFLRLFAQRIEPYTSKPRRLPRGARQAELTGTQYA